MTLKNATPLGLSCAALALALAFHPTSSPAAQTAAATPPSGAQVYATHCAACHGASLQNGGAPALKRPDIASQKRADLLDTIKSSMPMDNPGSLTDPEYQAVTDFILAQNKTK
jgi:mono/diheme cytochrome c family protein